MVEIVMADQGPQSEVIAPEAAVLEGGEGEGGVRRKDDKSEESLQLTKDQRALLFEEGANYSLKEFKGLEGTFGEPGEVSDVLCRKAARKEKMSAEDRARVIKELRRRSAARMTASIKDYLPKLAATNPEYGARAQKAIEDGNMKLFSFILLQIAAGMQLPQKSEEGKAVLYGGSELKALRESIKGSGESVEFSKDTPSAGEVAAFAFGMFDEFGGFTLADNATPEDLFDEAAKA